MKNRMLFLSVIFVLLVAGCIGKETVTIVDERFTVGAGQNQYFYKDLNTGDEVEVSLAVLEGGNQDIDFYISDSDGSKLVTRPKVGRTTISWIAPSSGTFYFNYDNGMSLVTTKIVKTTIKVTR